MISILPKKFLFVDFRIWFACGHFSLAWNYKNNFYCNISKNQDDLLYFKFISFIRINSCNTAIKCVN